MDDAKIRVNGIRALNEVLGPVATLRFLTLLRHEPTDCVEISRWLYRRQTTDQIFARAKRHWKG